MYLRPTFERVGHTPFFKNQYLSRSTQFSSVSVNGVPVDLDLFDKKCLLLIHVNHLQCVLVICLL